MSTDAEQLHLCKSMVSSVIGLRLRSTQLTWKGQRFNAFQGEPKATMASDRKEDTYRASCRDFVARKCSSTADYCNELSCNEIYRICRILQHILDSILRSDSCRSTHKTEHDLENSASYHNSEYGDVILIAPARGFPQSFSCREQQQQLMEISRRSLTTRFQLSADKTQIVFRKPYLSKEYYAVTHFNNHVLKCFLYEGDCLDFFRGQEASINTSDLYDTLQFQNWLVHDKSENCVADLQARRILLSCGT